MQASELLWVADNNFMKQIVSEALRINNILDLVVTNDSDLIHSVQVVETIMTDHSLTEMSIHSLMENREPQKTSDTKFKLFQ